MSWKNGPIIDKKGIGSKHHIFTYDEVRKKMVKIYGKPTTPFEHEKIQELTEDFMNNQPVIEMDRDYHDEIHNQN